jgi:hypothetical protein
VHERFGNVTALNFKSGHETFLLWRQAVTLDFLCLRKAIFNIIVQGDQEEGARERWNAIVKMKEFREALVAIEHLGNKNGKNTVCRRPVRAASGSGACIGYIAR